MRVTRYAIEAAISGCALRKAGPGAAGYAISQSETVRGEPRSYSVLCAGYKMGRIMSPMHNYGFCDCAQPDGKDCPSQKSADARAEIVNALRRLYHKGHKP